MPEPDDSGQKVCIPPTPPAEDYDSWRNRHRLWSLGRWGSRKVHDCFLFHSARWRRVTDVSPWPYLLRRVNSTDGRANMKKRASTLVASTMLVTAGMIGFGSSPASASPGYCPAGTGQSCFRNWANCDAAGAGVTGQVGVQAYHVRSSGGASSRVYYIKASSASNGYHKVTLAQERSGGGGTQYWYRNYPWGDTNLNGYTNTYEELDYASWPWASISVNPYVQMVFKMDGEPSSTCSASLNFNTPYNP